MPDPISTPEPSKTTGEGRSFEVEGRVLYSAYRRRYDIRWDWADLPEVERQEWRDDARRKAAETDG